MTEAKPFVIEVRSATALEAPVFVDLFERAFEDGDHPDGEACRRWCQERTARHDSGLLVAMDGGIPVGLAVLSTQTDCWSPVPQVLMLFAEPGSGARSVLVERMQDWFKERGVHRARACNMSGASDRGALRLYRVPGRSLGGLLEFTF